MLLPSGHQFLQRSTGILKTALGAFRPTHILHVGSVCPFTDAKSNNTRSSMDLSLRVQVDMVTRKTVLIRI